MAIATTLPAAVTALGALQAAVTALFADMDNRRTFEIGDYRVDVNNVGVIINLKRR